MKEEEKNILWLETHLCLIEAPFVTTGIGGLQVGTVRHIHWCWTRVDASLLLWWWWKWGWTCPGSGHVVIVVVVVLPPGVPSSSSILSNISLVKWNKKTRSFFFYLWQRDVKHQRLLALLFVVGSRGGSCRRCGGGLYLTVRSPRLMKTYPATNWCCHRCFHSDLMCWRYRLGWWDVI